MIKIVLLLIGSFAIANCKYIDTLKLSNREKLGEKNSGRIINGEPAAVNQFPWHATIQTIPANTICGGSLISSTFVLTSANCVRLATSVTIGLGSITIGAPTVSLTSNIIRMHPQFNPQNINNDVALIQLPLQVGPTISIQIIQLARRVHVGQELINTVGTITGFGSVTVGNFVLKHFLFNEFVDN